MPVTVAATVTLYMVRILKTPLWAITLPLRTTSYECLAGVISELLRRRKNVSSIKSVPCEESTDFLRGNFSPTEGVAYLHRPQCVPRRCVSSEGRVGPKFVDTCAPAAR